MSLAAHTMFARQYFEVCERRRRIHQARKVAARSVAGRWHKDYSASDSMQATEELFELTLLARRGARLVSNLVIEDTEEFFQTKVKVWCDVGKHVGIWLLHR
jgi:hypothetical protein